MFCSKEPIVKRLIDQKSGREIPQGQMVDGYIKVCAYIYIS